MVIFTPQQELIEPYPVRDIFVTEIASIERIGLTTMRIKLAARDMNEAFLVSRTVWEFSALCRASKLVEHYLAEARLEMFTVAQ